MNAENEPYDRYSRQIPLPGFGVQGQDKLCRAKVLVVGAGGLGSPVIQYLAASGIGTLGIVDGDRVELSNLHRQLLYTTDDIGKQKAVIAAEKTCQINPGVGCKSYAYQLDNKNAVAIIRDYDVIVDCTDNFLARYILSDVCQLLEKPLVFAAVFQYEGQVAVFNAAPNRITYRDLFPEPPDAASVPDCNAAGVLGVLPGLIGMLQATEVIKILTGIGDVLAGKLLNYDMRTQNSMVIELTAREVYAGPKTIEEISLMDYEWFCGSKSIDAIDKDQLSKLLRQENTIAIDVRETIELPDAVFPHQRIPMSSFDSMPDFSGFHNIIVFCQSGTRSVKAAAILKEKFGSDKSIFHLAGGLTAYNRDNNG